MSYYSRYSVLGRKSDQGYLSSMWFKKGSGCYNTYNRNSGGEADLVWRKEYPVRNLNFEMFVMRE